jgi:hypothetical protein
MSETDEPKPEEAVEGQTADVEEEEPEEGGWPAWLSWALVIAAAVFGGFLLGAQGGGGSAGSAESLAVKQREALMRTEVNRLKEQNSRRFDQFVHSFCREMIRVGLFRDGLDKNLEEMTVELGKIAEQLGKKDVKPEDRAAKAGAELKKVQERFAKVAAVYSTQKMAMDKVGRIGSYDHHLAYFYLVRIEDLMADAKAGDERALKEARNCRERVAQIDPKLASDLVKKYPTLASQPGKPAQAPATKPAK